MVAAPFTVGARVGDAHRAYCLRRCLRIPQIRWLDQDLTDPRLCAAVVVRLTFAGPKPNVPARGASDPDLWLAAVRE